MTSSSGGGRTIYIGNDKNTIKDLIVSCREYINSGFYVMNENKLLALFSQLAERGEC